MNNAIVRAIDLGNGLVKYTTASNDDSSDVVCAHFPSEVVRASSSESRMLSISTRDTVIVPVSDQLFEVGPDIEKVRVADEVRNELRDDWYQRPEYRALMKGALHKMNESSIDLLVIGLPVHIFLNRAQREALVSEFERSNIDLGNKTVDIKKVVVRAQPMGAYLSVINDIDAIDEINKALDEKNAGFRIESTQQLLKETCTLVIDPGQYTLDHLWIEGGVVNERASNSNPGCGHHRYLKAYLSAIEAEVGRPLNSINISRIRDALRDNAKFSFQGRLMDLSVYKQMAQDTLTDSFQRLKNDLRGVEDAMNLIILAGGHPEFYKEKIEEVFPYVTIYVPKDSVYANVRGFQAIGELTVARGL